MGQLVRTVVKVWLAVDGIEAIANTMDRIKRRVLNRKKNPNSDSIDFDLTLYNITHDIGPVVSCVCAHQHTIILGVQNIGRLLKEELKRDYCFAAQTNRSLQNGASTRHWVDNKVVGLRELALT